MTRQSLHQVDWTKIALALIVAAGAALRLYQLDANSLWVDEIGQVLVARDGVWLTLQRVTSHAAAAPLDYIVTSLMWQFSKDDFALRLPAALWGILSIYFLYRLGESIWSSRQVGLVAAALLAIVPAHIEYSREVRFYSLFTMFSILMIWTFVLAIRRDRNRDWILFTLTSVVCVYVHYYSIFLLIAAGGFVLLGFILNKNASRVNYANDLPNTRILPKFLLSSFVVFVAVVPWVLYAKAGHSSAYTLFQFANPLSENLFLYPIISYPPNYLVGYVVFPVLALIGAMLVLAQRRSFALLPIMLLVVSPPGVLALDALFSYFYVPRQLLFLAPFYILLIAAGITQIFRPLPFAKPYLQAVGPGVVVAVLVFLLTPQLVSLYNTPKENWRDAANFLQSAVNDGKSGIVVAPDDLQMYLLYYQPSLQRYLVPENSLFDGSAGKTYSRLWLLSSSDVAQRTVAQGWTSIDVSLEPEPPGRRLSYLGNVPEQTLLTEVANFDLMPKTIAYAYTGLFLAKLQNVDPALATAAASRAVGLINEGHVRIMDLAKAQVLANVGRLYSDLGQQDVATYYLLQARAYYADEYAVQESWGILYLRTNQCVNAAKVFRSIVGDAPSNWWDHMLLGDAYRCGQQWSDAAIEYHRAFELQASPNLLLSEAQAYLQAGDKQRASGLLRELVSNFADSAQAKDAQEILRGLQP